MFIFMFIALVSHVSAVIHIDDMICSKVNRNAFIIAYADDILLLTPSVTALQYLFRHCEVQLNYLDMSINHLYSPSTRQHKER